MKLFVFFLLILTFVATISGAQNLFQNPGFENGLDSFYVTSAKEGAEVTFDITGIEMLNGDSALMVDIKSIPTGGPQVIGVYQYIDSLDVSKSYEFKFAVKGPVGQKIRARIQGDAKQVESFTISEGYNYYTWNIDVLNSSSDQSHKIGLEFGSLPDNKDGGAWYIDDWSFKAAGEEPKPLNVAYISSDGDDNAEGTYSQPLKTLEAAVQRLIGDTIYLLEGTYYEELTISDLSGTASNPKVITAYPGHKVKFDGTISIDSEWEAYKENIYKTKLNQDIWQLFVDQQMLNAARWPNVDGFIEDEQPIKPLPLPNSLWDQPGTWGKSDENSTEGQMIDDGTMNLAGQDSSFTDAISIMNIGSFRTSSALITSHNPGENHFDYRVDDLQVHWEKPDMAYYYIEGKLDLLDHPGEWFYEPTTKELFVWTKSGAKPESGMVRGKVQTYAIQLDNCNHFEVKNIEFWGTTIKSDNCDNLAVANCTFTYPSHSRRMLRDQSKPAVTEFIGGDYVRFINNVVQYTDGEALHMTGANHLIENNLMRHIDFTCVNLYMIGGTINFKGNHNIFRNNTIYIAGASETVTPGSYNTVEGNEIYSIGFLQNDGSMIQYMQDPSIGSITRYNWFHDCLKSGMRYDGPLDVGNTGQPGIWTAWEKQTKGQVYKNVIWNTPTGLMIKGDYHVIVNNTVFDNEKVGICMINPKPDGANSNSIIKNNVSGMLSGYRGGRTPDEYPLPGDHSHNWNGFYEDDKVEDILQDISNRDFRPVKDVGLIDTGTAEFNSSDLSPEHTAIDSTYDIGAYEYNDSIYYIPGRRLEKCSHPIPFNEGTTNSDDVILAWRPAYNATSFNVYVGTSQNAVVNADQESEEYKGQFRGNVFVPDEIAAGSEIFWRVDAWNGDKLLKGNIWSFIAGMDANKDTTIAVNIGLHNTGLSLYPNPMKQYLYVKSSLNEELNYELLGIHGNQIMKGKISEPISQIMVNDLKQGMYMFRIIETGEIIKLMKL